MSQSFKNKVAIITGSSRGIGKAIAIELAKKGAMIVLNGRDKERLDKSLQEVQGYTKHVHAFCGDVSDSTTANELIEYTLQQFGKIDLLINNVGVSMRGNVVDLHPTVVTTLFESNVYGSIYPTIAAIPHIRKTKGSIQFISSLAGIRGLPGLSIYSSAKMALRAFAESLRIEESQHHIHVGLIYVGVTMNETDKQTLSANGTWKNIEARDQSKVLSMEKVATVVIQNIQKRKFISTLTSLGKLNRFMQWLAPQLVEKIILKNLYRFEKDSK